MAKHANHNGRCVWCAQAWPCATEIRRRPRRAAQGVKTAPTTRTMIDWILADLEKRGPSTRDDVVTRVYVERDGTANAIRRALAYALVIRLVVLRPDGLVEGLPRRATSNPLTAPIGDVERVRCRLVRVVARAGRGVPS
jgi:hypothetical protein